MPGTQEAVSSVKDPYDELAPHYDKAIGSLDQRSDQYKNFFANILKQHGCKYVLDVSCGTGIDSAILLDHGFKVVSTDGSAQMLEFAKKIKQDRAGQLGYDEWVIKQAFWETLPEDIAKFLPKDTQFDAVVCLANSIAHILDEDGKQTKQRKCLRNLANFVKPGGVLLIDHRNYDAMLNNIQPPTHNAYYKYQNPIAIKSTLIRENGKPIKVSIDFHVDVVGEGKTNEKSKLRLYTFPHRVQSFTHLLDEAFDNRAVHRVYGDFQPLGQIPVPSFYLHVLMKSL